MCVHFGIAVHVVVAVFIDVLVIGGGDSAVGGDYDAEEDTLP